MKAPEEVKRLVERFRENREAYLSSEYNETQLRREFLDPFFKALGWDVDNEQGYAEAYKDVVHEDAIKVGGATKAPDYAFRIGGTRKFFVEAKRPSVGIKDDPDAAYQLRRYAWSAKLPLSILTDFEEFAVYDTRARPNNGDKASIARTFYFTFEEYDERWDEIAGIFSRDAILKGSFDKYVEAKKMRGTAEVDNAFLAEIEGWRDVLARNIALRNTELSNRELNFAVQRTIDRIIFLRICEARGIEEYGRLMALRNGTQVYPRLCEIFHRADERYNSGLFHFRKEKDRGESPDELTLGIEIDDKVLKDVFKDLYYPDSPYEFSVLPADILGHIYEQFLGKVIRLTPAHRAVVEEKPEVRKAGGVYYTPTYIVDYIVEHTVGKLLEGKTPSQVAKLRILDPACGSGSFLLGAYQRLLDWHLAWYTENDPAKHAKGRQPKLFQGLGGDLRLTTAEKKRILLNNIYGVDIDPQAVEVTKLSLLLKVLEGESEETLGKTLRMFHERALPDLGENIKCGNSLIGPDFYEGKQLSLIDEEERYRINALDWSAEFPEIMKAGGFDTVIGNPPYIRIQAMKEWAPIEVEFYKQRYTAASKGNYDIYVVFVERALQLLNKSGRMGFILPHKFFQAKYGEPLRQLIAEGQNLGEIVHFGDQQVFPRASTYTCLLFLVKEGSESSRFIRVNDLAAWRSEGRGEAGKVPAKAIAATEWTFTVGAAAELLARLRTVTTTLRDVADIFVGLQTSADRIYVVPLDTEIEEELTKPFLSTGNLSAYESPRRSARLIFPYAIEDGEARLLSANEIKEKYPQGWSYLTSHREILMSRERGKWHHDRWYAFGRSQNLTQMDADKLIIQVTAQRPTVLLDERGLYMTGGGSGPFYGIRPKKPAFSIKYLLAILNSTLFGWVVKQQSTNLRGGYIKFSKQYIETMPIRMPHDADPGLVEDLLAPIDGIIGLIKRRDSEKSPHERDVLDRQARAAARKIDQLVYELYGLTDKEIRIVEEEHL